MPTSIVRLCPKFPTSNAKATAEDTQATQAWDGVPAPSGLNFDDDLDKELERLMYDEAGTHVMLQSDTTKP